MSANVDKDLELLHENNTKIGGIIGALEVDPGDKKWFQLGFYTAKNPPKGFYTEVSSGSRPVDSVVARIVSIGTDKRYRLVLHVANFSDQAITVKIGRLENTEPDSRSVKPV